jgi:hypothetical protein
VEGAEAVVFMRLFLFIFLSIPFLCNAQNNMGIGTISPDPSSILDLSANDKGVLVPRLTTQQRINIANPANGLLVFDTDDGCFFFYQSITTSWINLCNTGGIGPTGATGPSGGPPGPIGATGAAGANGIANVEIFSLSGQQTTISDTFPDFAQITGLDTTIVLTDTAFVSLLFTGNYKPVNIGTSGSQSHRGIAGLFMNSSAIPLTMEAVTVAGALEAEWTISKTLNLLPGSYHFQVKASKSNPYSSGNFYDIIACPCFSDFLNPVNCNNRHCNFSLQVFYK